MGEIADMMLDGTLCECCGIYIGDDAGYPRYCSDKCALARGADVSLSESKEEAPPFFLRRKEDFAALKRWLGKRTFNCGGYFRDDRKGNPMVTIGYDRKPDSDWSMPDKRGLIIVTDKALLADVEAMVQASITAQRGSAPAEIDRQRADMATAREIEADMDGEP